MALTTKEKQRKFRSTPHGRKYLTDYMREQRRYYRKAYLKGDIAYKDIPKSYRYFVEKKKV